MGFANSFRGLIKAMLMQYVPKEARARWNAFDSVRSFSWSGSAAIGGFLVTGVGYQNTFLITAILKAVGLIPFVPLFYFVPDGKKYFRTGPKVPEGDNDLDEHLLLNDELYHGNTQSSQERLNHLRNSLNRADSYQDNYNILQQQIIQYSKMASQKKSEENQSGSLPKSIASSISKAFKLGTSPTSQDQKLQQGVQKQNSDNLISTISQMNEVSPSATPETSQNLPQIKENIKLDNQDQDKSIQRKSKSAPDNLTSDTNLIEQHVQDPKSSEQDDQQDKQQSSQYQQQQQQQLQEQASQISLPDNVYTDSKPIQSDRSIPATQDEQIETNLDQEAKRQRFRDRWKNFLGGEVSNMRSNAYRQYSGQSQNVKSMMDYTSQQAKGAYDYAGQSYQSLQEQRTGKGSQSTNTGKKKQEAK